MSPLCEPSAVLPDDHQSAILIGRVYDPEVGGPSVVLVGGDQLLDITALGPTVSDLLDRPSLLDDLASVADGTGEGAKSWSLTEVLTATVADDGAAGNDRVRLLSPIDLQVIKAAGVTFAKSMLERVIEERAEGDPTQAELIRTKISESIGGTIARVRPGTEEAERAKEILIAEGLWSQYLEVGIGPDPEIFSKAPVLSSVGTGAEIGVLARSTWNNPEPEVVLVATSDGRPVGATLGNDVNLRDFEGRSALLLGEAKDNNASCALGPFIRLFDDDFDLDQLRTTVVDLDVRGSDDGFHLSEHSSLEQMSRTLEDLLTHTRGDHHQYPDGFVLFTGTMFAPTQDRDEPGMGFTHHQGDIVTISTPRLGSLVNRVTTAEAAPDWTFGIRQLISNLADRGLLASR